MRQENIEFLALYEASGWSGAEVSRRLHREPSTISRWKNGIDPADRTAIELFKILLATEKPEALKAITLREESLSPWERKILEDLKDLHEEDRNRVIKAIKAFVEGLPRRQIFNAHGDLNPKNKISSDHRSPEEKFVDELEAEADRRLALKAARKPAKVSLPPVVSHRSKKENA